MVWSILLIVLAVLFAVGFLWPGMWFVAIGVVIVWLASMLLWGVSRRDATTPTLDERRPRHRVE